ncbi:divergent polysaccharide deacetylase family protein [Tistlia consotensis]|uniref:divergent polysaccharide deacetylase family protein n=1 Tax=Tistlia consotensis TaxID=1321365 RepID=UPI000A147C89|nr:divergent polysaccharide deacetylase family protein [Tistlia consotensis]
MKDKGRGRGGRQPGRPRRRGLLALALAWLLLLLAVGGALIYAFLSYQAGLPEPAVTPPPRFEEAPVPAPQPPEQSPAGPAGAVPSEAMPSTAAPEPAEAPTEPPAGPAPTQRSEAEHTPTAPPPPAKPDHGTEGSAGQHAGPEQQAAIPKPEPAPPPAPVEPAWQRFAMPYAGAPSVPRIAVVVTGLGLHDSLTREAIEDLPAGITLSFSPYARGVETWLAQARANGHEVMLDLPMEPTSYPNSDPGHFALFVSKTPEQNLDQLSQVLARGSAYVGVAAVMGSRFTADADALRPVLSALGARGLIFLDNSASDNSVAVKLGRQLGVPTLYNDRTLDGEFVQANAIDSRLAQVERLARTKGVAIAMANVYPTTFRQLETWAAGLKEKGLALAPISSLIGRQPPPE